MEIRATASPRYRSRNRLERMRPGAIQSAGLWRYDWVSRALPSCETRPVRSLERVSNDLLHQATYPPPPTPMARLCGHPPEAISWYTEARQRSVLPSSLELTDADELELEVGKRLNPPHRAEVPIAKRGQYAVDTQLRGIDPRDRCEL